MSGMGVECATPESELCAMAKLSQGAAEFLNQDMLAAERDLSGLDAQIFALQSKREGLTRKIELLKAELKAGDGAVTLTLKGPNGNVDLSDMLPGDTELPTTFRDFLRRVLRESAKGMKPKDVLTAVRKMGYAFDGVKDPSTRTSSELWRMAQMGDIQKRGGFYYARQGERH